MDKQKLRYTKYDLFLLFPVGLLAGILIGILIIMLSVKEMDKVVTLLIGIFPLLAAAAMVVYQMERQHKDNYLLQLSNHKEELKLKVYKEISEDVSCAMQSYQENQILVNSLMLQYHNCVICQDANKNPSPKIYIKDTELSDAHSRMLRSLAQLMNKLAEYEIVDKNIEIFRTALASAFQLISDAHLEFQGQIFDYLPHDDSKEIQKQLGVKIEHVKSPNQQDLEVIEHSFNSYTEANLEGYCFVSDLSREAQNVLLGNLFDNQVPPREPLDPYYVVVTTKPEETERLRVYFTKKDDDGLTQHQKDFMTRTDEEK